MNNTIVKTDVELKTDVLSELNYEPSVKVTDIGVLVKDGTVTLNGYATSYVEKRKAVQAAKRVAGVKAIADDIAVNLPGSLHCTNGDIAAAAFSQIDRSTTATVEITVRDGWVTLTGEVERWEQKNAADLVVHNLQGVKGVSNLISIKPKLMKAEAEKAIKSAFKRSDQLDAHKIQVELSENEVILRGNGQNLIELEEAKQVAWAALGELSVDDQMTVKWADFAV
jgi:osmotically-inducible protein OsmY